MHFTGRSRVTDCILLSGESVVQGFLASALGKEELIMWKIAKMLSSVQFSYSVMSDSL